jgi:hypothetical protein
MKRIMLSVLLVLCAASLLGCAKKGRMPVADSLAMPMTPAAPPGSMSEVAAQDRMLVWTADLQLQVWNVSNTLRDVTAQVERQGGFITAKSDSGDTSASATIRIPAKAFKQTVAGLEELGTVTYRNVSSEDVTTQYIDTEARLKNKIVLRNRLKELLEKATAVKDILAIETELNRVQGDIESMEALIKSLKNQVDLATIQLRLERKPIPGPLGYVFKGLWWGFGKLFILRD